MNENLIIHDFKNNLWKLLSRQSTANSSIHSQISAFADTSSSLSKQGKNSSKQSRMNQSLIISRLNLLHFTAYT